MPLRFNHRTPLPKVILKSRKDCVRFFLSFDKYVPAAGVKTIWDNTRVRPDEAEDRQGADFEDEVDYLP